MYKYHDSVRWEVQSLWVNKVKKYFSQYMEIDDPVLEACLAVCTSPEMLFYLEEKAFYREKTGLSRDDEEEAIILIISDTARYLACRTREEDQYWVTSEANDHGLPVIRDILSLVTCFKGAIQSPDVLTDNKSLSTLPVSPIGGMYPYTSRLRMAHALVCQNAELASIFKTYVNNNYLKEI